MASSKSDNDIQQPAPVEPISENNYNERAEAFSEKCKCGGKFSFGASPRCPKWRSMRIGEGEIAIIYDQDWHFLIGQESNLLF